MFGISFFKITDCSVRGKNGTGRTFGIKSWEEMTPEARSLLEDPLVLKFTWFVRPPRLRISEVSGIRSAETYNMYERDKKCIAIDLKKVGFLVVAVAAAGWMTARLAL